MLKRRTREHVIADLSVNHVERFILLCEWTVERITHDYGLDLDMNSYATAGEPQSGRVYLQVKSTDKLKMQKNRTLALRLDTRDILAWLHEPMPVMIILYDASGMPRIESICDHILPHCGIKMPGERSALLAFIFRNQML
jgi:hypothetical protein